MVNILHKRQTNPVAIYNSECSASLQQAICDFGEQRCLFVRANNNSTVCA